MKNVWWKIKAIILKTGVNISLYQVVITGDPKDVTMTVTRMLSTDSLEILERVFKISLLPLLLIAEMCGQRTGKWAGIKLRCGPWAQHYGWAAVCRLHSVAHSWQPPVPINMGMAQF